MAFAVPIMKTNFAIYMLEERPIRYRNLSTCSASSTSSTSSRGSQISLNSTASTKSSKSTRSNASKELIYKSRWDLTDPLASLGKR